MQKRNPLKNARMRAYFMVSRHDRFPGSISPVSPGSRTSTLGRGSETHLFGRGSRLRVAPATPSGGFMLIPITPNRNAIECTTKARDKTPARTWFSPIKPYFEWRALQLPEGAT